MRFPTPPARMMAICFILGSFGNVDLHEFLHEHFHVLLVPDGDAQESGGISLAAEDEDAAVLEFVGDVLGSPVLRRDADEASFRRDVGISGLVEGFEQTLLAGFELFSEFLHDAVVVGDHLLGDGERHGVHRVVRLVVADVLGVLGARYHDAHAQPRHREHLRERAQDDEVVVFLEQRERRLLVEQVVGLVDDDERVVCLGLVEHLADLVHGVGVADGHVRVHQRDEAGVLVDFCEELLDVEGVVLLVVDELGVHSLHVGVDLVHAERRGDADEVLAGFAEHLDDVAHRDDASVGERDVFCCETDDLRVFFGELRFFGVDGKVFRCHFRHRLVEKPLRNAVWVFVLVETDVFATPFGLVCAEESLDDRIYVVHIV